MVLRLEGSIKGRKQSARPVGHAKARGARLHRHDTERARWLNPGGRFAAQDVKSSKVMGLRDLAETGPARMNP